MNSNNCSGQNVSINVNLSLKNETLRMLIEMANDMGASLEDVISSITEDSVIDLERLQDDLGIVIIPEKCSKCLSLGFIIKCGFKSRTGYNGAYMVYGIWHMNVFHGMNFFVHQETGKYLNHPHWPKSLNFAQKGMRFFCLILFNRFFTLFYSV